MYHRNIHSATLLTGADSYLLPVLKLLLYPLRFESYFTIFGVDRSNLVNA